MAIVKFVADKECIVFIDLELAGKVAPDSMLKVSLETGDYFIQIKDDDGHLIKEYDLKIKASDNQVLQKINESNCQIEDVIENLRNDSSLHFYHQRAIFCYNGNYGYINSQYKIAIEPIYSYAENFTNGLALVKKIFPNGEMATVIDTDGNISLDRWYDYIGGNEKTVLLKSEKTFYVLTKVDYSIVNQYLDAKYNGKGELIPVHQHIEVDDMYGYIDRAGTEVIPLIYDFAGNFKSNNLATVKRFGEYNAVDLNGNLYRYGIHSYNSEQRKRKKIENGEPVDTSPANKEFLSKDESRYRGFPSHYGIHYPVKKGIYWGFNSDEEPCWDRIIYISDSFLVYRKNGICYIVGKENISIEADDIILVFSWDYRPTDEYSYLQYIIVKRMWKYGIVDLKKNIILPIDYDYIESTDAHVPIESQGAGTSADIAIVWKKDKCSMFNMQEREFIVPFEFEDIVVNENFDNSLNPIMDSSFLMKKNGKYGLIANDCETIILPYEYDKIVYDVVADFYMRCERIILTKNGKMGIIQKYHYYNEVRERWEDVDIIFDEEFDECVFLEDNINKAKLLDVAVRKANKWAIINCCNGNVDAKKLLFRYDSLDEIDKVRKGLLIGKMTLPGFHFKRKKSL